jgi:hypothetical protein
MAHAFFPVSGWGDIFIHISLVKAPLPEEEKYDMFEALFRITALVESDGLGQCAFKVYEQRDPLCEHEFSSLIQTVYAQQVSQMLQIGAELTMILHVNLPNHELEKTVRVREDRQFEGDWLPKPTTDPFPLLLNIYEHFRRQVIPGNVLTITFHVQPF